NRPAVQWLNGDGLENQEVQRALDEIRRLPHVIPRRSTMTVYNAADFVDRQGVRSPCHDSRPVPHGGAQHATPLLHFPLQRANPHPLVYATSHETTEGPEPWRRILMWPS